jgi:hypothetical protein
MRVFVAALLLSIVPGIATAQTSTGNDPKFSVQFTAGPTMIDGGHSVAGGFGFAPIPELTFVATVQRDHLDFRQTPLSTFRGGTVTTVSGEARYEPLPRLRVSPFVTAGMGWGESKPNVEGPYTTPVTNNAQTLFAGGGLRIPITRQLSLIGEARFMLVAETSDVAGIAPLRVGLAWRF